jgi:hypothetical protein
MKIHWFAVLVALPALAQTPSPKGAASSEDIAAPPRAKATKAVGGEVAAAGAVHGWDNWYTVTLNGKIPYEYYHETIETQDGRMIYRLHAWKKEEEFINEEQLGAYAQASDLTPLFFNFHSTYRGSEKTIDGTVQDGRMLVIKSSEGTAGSLKEKPLIRRSISKGIFFSSFFPVWVARQGAKLKPGHALPFSSILEDGGDNPAAPFSNASGTLKPIAGGEPRFEVDFRNQKSQWTFDAQGAPSRIVMPASRAIVERVTEKVAKQFLGPTQ